MVRTNISRKRNGFRGRHSFRRRNGFRRRGIQTQHLVETFAFDVRVTNSMNITVATIAGLPPSRDWRPIVLRVRATGGYIKQTAVEAGSYAPSAIQLQFADPANASIDTTATSRCIMLGPMPRSLVLHYPRSQNWISATRANDVLIGKINAICVGSATIDAVYVRGIATLTYRIQSKILSAGCPTYSINDPECVKHHDNDYFII